MLTSRLKRLSTRRNSPYREDGYVVQPSPQLGHTDGALCRSHLREYRRENGLSSNTPVGHTSMRLPLNSLSSVPLSARPKYTWLRRPNTPKSRPPAYSL